MKGSAVSRKRIAAIILIILLLGCFSGMIVALIRGNYSLFFTLGGVIVLLVITGLVLVKLVRKNMLPEEEKEGKED